MKKVMVITGAASGLGRALAVKAAEEYRIVILDQQATAANELVNELSKGGYEAVFFKCDVSDAKQMQDCSDQVMGHYGQVDVLINNAGIASEGSVVDSSEAQWQRVLNINLMGVVHGCRSFVPLLKKQQNSAVVNISSFAAIALVPYMASYNVSKASVLALSETLRGELADSGVHVAVACPAFFTTALTDSMTDSNEAMKARIKKWMANSSYTAEDVANQILVAIKNKQYMVLCDAQTRRQWRVSRWLPQFFYRQKIKWIRNENR